MALVASDRPSTAPADALFKRFYEAITDSQEGQGLWDKIQGEDIVYNIFDSEKYSQTPLEGIVKWVLDWARTARDAGDFPRDTYKDNVNLILVFGGEMILPGFSIPRPPPVDKSRFLSTSTNYLILELCKNVPEVKALYTEQEWEEIRVMAIFSAFFYIAWMCLAKYAHMAPANLLKAVQHLRELKKMPEFAELAVAALAKREGHIQMLSHELCIFELFNIETATSSYQSRKDMAVALKSWLPSWEPGNFLVNSYYVPGPDFCDGDAYWENGRPSLATFTSRHSFLLFELLGQEPADLAWLEEEPSEWMEYDSYKKAYDYVTKLRVTNDIAERNINLLVTKMKKVRTHQRLQEAMVTTENMRRLRKLQET